MDNQEIRDLKRKLYNLGSELNSSNPSIRQKARLTLESVAQLVVQLIDLYENEDAQEVVELYGQYTQ